MAAKYVPPPVFDEKKSWIDYKKEIKIWQALTDLPAKKQGPSLYLSLQGKAREAALEIDLEDLKKDTGVQTILDRLDKLYLQDINQSAYLAYQKFETFKRPDKMPMKEYLIQFEQLYTKIKDHNMTLPDGVLAYRVLNSANLNQEEMKLCRATINELKYDAMVKQLLRIYGDSVSPSFTTTEDDIQGERVFYSNNLKQTQGINRGTSRGRRGNNYSYGGKSQYRAWVGTQNINAQQNKHSTVASIQQRKPNPLDSSGNISRCSICESIFHWARKCPHAYENQSQTSEKTPETITLFQSPDHDIDEMRVFVGETFSCAVLDSGCTQTVCGRKWLDCYCESLSNEGIVEQKPSTAAFKFGNGKPVISDRKVVIPAVIGSQKVNIKTDVIDADIPLLMSKAAMKKAETVLNFNDDSVTMFGEHQQLLKTSSGHYAIPISRSRKVTESEENPEVSEECCLLTLNPKTRKEKETLVNKLHRQFCHCSSNKLKNLIKSSKLWKDDLEVLHIVDEISSKCDICKIYKKTPLRPTVGLPLASEFNHTVAMDLITIKQGVWILHLIDMFSRYSVACIRRSKKPSAIIDAILKTWISYFGQPQRFLTDNGGEFANAEYKEMCEAFNIEVATTAAESPWSNGLCERHNGVLKQSVNKVIEDTKCSLETAVSWAVSAKNTLHGHHGYSPNTIVFGKNPNMPSVLHDKLPALEENVSSITVEQNLAAMRSAREAFIQSESSEKIKRALKSNVRSCSEAKFENGDRVYYKRNDCDKWRGPGSVIGQENKQVLVKHGSEYVRAHISRLIHCTNVDFKPVMENHNESVNTQISLDEVINKQDFQSKDGDNHEAITATTNNMEQISKSENVPAANTENIYDQNNQYSHGSNKQYLPKLKSRIAYRLKDEDQWRDGTVHSDVKNNKDKFGSCLNLEDQHGNIKLFDFSNDVEEWEPVCEEVLLTSNLREESVQIAKLKELNS